jgi:hypothetical protein
LVELLLGLEDGDILNAETTAAFEEVERNGGKSLESVEELTAEIKRSSRSASD